MNTKPEIDKLIEKYKAKKGVLIPLLQDVQSIEGYLSRENMKYIAEKMGIREAEIFGVATFYSMFRLKPLGKHIIRVCKGTACHVSGANNISTAIRNVLDLKDDEDQTADGFFTFIEVACLGCCSLAPVIMIDDKTYGKLTSEKVSQIVKSYYK
ncbi:MAG TPA: NADH-quinone oxidoreductase subunit NuoE [Candidatus Cloacimonadota bacterium]|jgi:NADH-quinone oxidoreductase subunit E|nr:NADH-quinone oxidoreductase subunit NuoE [Candidatus Cloacimonadales bacterium]HOE91566.1 NADH-quinone oxidoreductase subunit NuoE [Candidatus Cloacimonadota bacterium]HOQ79831.1 NADH-quinone oxidoreductase subunit NuoE [Candidatus Cloacimonadota bacterium]HPK40580.1 NADH-quinone oxidoreductase subunit NuoE [Candidatus Cloacimonadota bacterium]HPY96544.1 NADH-quinone oxidoreductase subunit NuoE [Candidatus Cloacimonadota bacterium]